MGLNLLSNSGASTNLEAIAGASISVLERGYKPDVIDGNSSGALIAPLLAMNRLNDLKYFALNYSLDSAFSIMPVNEKGSPTLKGLYRVAKGESSLGVMNNLVNTLKDAFSYSDWKRWRVDVNSPQIFVATVEYNTGKLFKTNLKKVRDYEDVIKYIIASASIPLMSEYVKINKGLHYDGGARTHSLAPYMQQHFKGKINRHISIYSRPKDFKILRDYDEPNSLDVLSRTLEIMTMEISKDNERQEMAFRVNNDLSLNDVVFMPKLLKTKVYDFGNNEYKFNVGYKAAKKVEL